MVNAIGSPCTLEVRCAEVDSVFLCADCVGCFEMRRSGSDLWATTLNLPVGHYRFRYYARIGDTVCWQGAEEVEIVSSEDSRNPDGTGNHASRFAE